MPSWRARLDVRKMEIARRESRFVNCLFPFDFRVLRWSATRGFYGIKTGEEMKMRNPLKVRIKMSGGERTRGGENNKKSRQIFFLGVFYLEGIFLTHFIIFYNTRRLISNKNWLESIFNDYSSSLASPKDEAIEFGSFLFANFSWWWFFIRE